MTTPRLATLRSALALFRLRFVLQQIALALVLFVLSVVWLQIPDANVFDIFGTIILALAILALAGGGESFLLLRLVGQAPSRAKLLRGTLILIAAVILWFGWSVAIDHVQAGNALRAGYENSRFSHLLRNVFSYRHIYLWLGWLDSILEWVGTGIIVLFAYCALAATYPLRAMARSFRSGTYWIALFVGVFLATAITSSLVKLDTRPRRAHRAAQSHPAPELRSPCRRRHRKLPARDPRGLHSSGHARGYAGSKPASHRRQTIASNELMNPSARGRMGLLAGLQ